MRLDTSWRGAYHGSVTQIFSGRRFVSAVALAAVPFLQAAGTKRQPAVNGSWAGAPSSIAMCRPIDLVLHVVATANASELTAEVTSERGIEVVSGTRRWVGSLLADQVIELPVRVRVVANGAWTLDATLTARPWTSVEVSHAVFNVVAADGKAVVGPAAPDLSGTRTEGARTPDRTSAARSQASRDRADAPTVCPPLDSELSRKR